MLTEKRQRGRNWTRKTTLRGSLLQAILQISETSRDIMAGDLSRRIKLAGTRDEFDRLAENLNLMLARIQSLMENVQQVSNDIAHDLRSPLARLREHLELVAENTTDMATRSEIEESIGQVDTALEIFAAMLRIAEVEAGARRRDFQMIDLSTLLKDLADTFETVADAESMYLSTDISDGLSVNGDRELLAQMFVNIIENAIHHSPSGSRIFITARSQGLGCSEVLISDNGPGIPSDEHERVLRRFVKLDASRHRLGTGLGLPLAVAVAELHNGIINLSDNEPGLRVAIALPTKH